MKRITAVLLVALLLFSFASCGANTVSDKKYEQIKAHVLENIENLTPESNVSVKFFDYKVSGILFGTVAYGYYYTMDNEVIVPDFYAVDDCGEPYEADGGTYFGTSNGESDWCFIKQITNNWYYYEWHKVQ